MPNGTVALPRTLGKKLGSLPIAIGSAILLIVGYAMSHGWKATLGPVLEKIGELSVPKPWGGSWLPLGWLGDASRAIERWFSDAQKYGEKGMVWGLVNFATFWVLIGAALYVMGESIFLLGEWTTSYVQKALSSHHTARTDPRIRQLEAAIERGDARLRDLERWKKAGGAAAGAQDWARLDRGIDRLKDRVKELEQAEHGTAHAHTKTGGRTVPRTRAPARRWSEVLTAAGLLSLGFALLRRFKLGWLRCTKVNKVGRFLCTDLNPGLLESLLLDAALLTVAFNLEEFAKEMQGVTDEAARLIHNWAT